MPTIELRLDAVAHGGIVVGRHDGKVVFVTGGLPGELVRAELTESTKRFDRARVVEVMDSSEHRVEPPCPIAGECGGCDWQHATPEYQLSLKTAVVAEQLSRLGGYEWTGTVQAVPPQLGWRTRMRYAVDAQGRVGMRGRRSHDVIPLPEQGCLIAALGPTAEDLARAAVAGSEIRVTVADDAVTVVTDERRVSGPATVHQKVARRTYAVDAPGFWQTHPEAASLLSERVLTALEPRPGERALDLYCGVGLFAGALVDAGCDVTGVELSRGAVARARQNVPEARFLAGPLERLLGKLRNPVDLVVLDPPRKGAGRAVVEHIVALSPRKAAYVACDPAALGRDLGYFREAGWEVVSVEAFDLFPMTHHIECVAILRPAHTSRPRY